MNDTVTLRTAISSLGHHRALLDKSVTVPGVELHHVPVADHADMFRRMGRDQEFDVCELGVVSYYTARQYGLPFRGLPVVPRHAFHHADFLVNRHAGITSPHDLVGRTVGTRSWTVTPGVLDRGILSDEYGIDPATITWLLSDTEHVAACDDHLPANVVPAAQPGDLFPSLVSGELAAGIAGANMHRQSSADVVRLFPDHVDLDRAQWERTGIMPPFTMIVVHERVLDHRPWLLEALYEAFAASLAVAHELTPPLARVVGDAPIPFGLAANRPGLEELLRLATAQGIVDGTAQLDDLFPDFD